MFNELADQRLNKVNELHKKVNLDDLVYKDKCKSPDEKFDKYDNALDFINKIRNGDVKLLETKNDQAIVKSYLGKIKKEITKKKIKEANKTHLKTLKCFTKQKTRLLNSMTIIL